MSSFSILWSGKILNCLLNYLPNFWQTFHMSASIQGHPDFELCEQYITTKFNILRSVECKTWCRGKWLLSQDYWISVDWTAFAKIWMLYQMWLLLVSLWYMMIFYSCSYLWVWALQLRNSSYWIFLLISSRFDFGLPLNADDINKKNIVL